MFDSHSFSLSLSLFFGLPQILAKLNEIVPPAKQPLQRQHSDVEQLGSLGVLYISATSSMLLSAAQGEVGDMGEMEEVQEVEEVEEAVDQPLRIQNSKLLPNLVTSNSSFAQQQQTAQQPVQDVPTPEDVNVDLLIATELQSEEQNALQRQIENDAFLAEQLQQRDYSYHRPADVTTPKRMVVSNSQSQGPAEMYDRSNLRKTPRGERWEREWRGEPVPPPAPPPPPLPSSVVKPNRSRSLQKYRSIARSHDTLAISETAKLKQFVQIFPRMKLKHVETVEKTVFPVGECYALIRSRGCRKWEV